VSADDAAAATHELKTLHRLYQITPSSEALQSAKRLGFRSAYDVASFPYSDFMTHYAGEFPSAAEASLVHRKARQVSAVSLNVAAAARHIGAAPAIRSLSPSPAVREATKAALIEQFPNMQSLFGSLDFCDCEDCRSVLSPAAYLVDILKFLDPDDQNWNVFLHAWSERHDGKEYSGLKPYDALTHRRPDLPRLPLTCENTNTVLPYIDLVNEILEYYIVHDRLEAEAVYDTGEALSADLVAEPQNILPQAYAKLCGARYPLDLPFDLWIETVRGFFGYLQTPLASVLEMFRPANELELFSDQNNYGYYRAAIFAEFLGISPAEYAVFTDPDSLRDWFKLYGYDDEATASQQLKSAKTLSQRLGVSYQDLVNLVDTGFLNPQLNTLVVLQSLNLQPDAVFSYQGEPHYPPLTAGQRAGFESLLDRLTKKYNPNKDADGFDARKWLSTVWSSGGFRRILLLADPGNEGSFDATALQFADGSPADALVLLKLNLFVRLWNKLGWTMDETDRAL
jgi:hypothetical protein